MIVGKGSAAFETIVALVDRLPAMITPSWVHTRIQPVAVRERPGAVRIERIRQVVAPDGSRTSEDDLIELRTVSAEGLAAEAEAHGLVAEPPLEIPATLEHVGSTVVMLRG